VSRARAIGRRTGRGLVLALGAVVCLIVVGGCYGSATSDQNDNAGPSLPTPLASLPGEVQGTLALVQEALAPLNISLAPPAQPYRPSEPAGLVTAPRSVQQETLAEPDLGYVVIYDLPDQASAADRARELAAYLGSGFGQTNYPVDAQFAISQVGDTVIFTWWAPSRAGGDPVPEQAFDAVSGVGQPVPVLK
jgi:hypothetical protein